MKIKCILDKIEEIAPISLAEEWDNSGLMVGSVDIECQGVMLALDVTMDVIQQAIRSNCNLIISHHPFIFSKLANIDVSESKGEMIEVLKKNDITVYSAHTNLDKSDHGLSNKLAKMFGGQDIVNDGLGTIFSMEEMTLENFAKKVGLKLADKSVKVVGNPDAKVKKVYVCSGAGGDTQTYLRAKEVADVFVTGDIKHHVYVDAYNDKYPLVEFSHYSSEIIMQDLLKDYLSPYFENLKIKKAIQPCPFRLLEEL